MKKIMLILLAIGLSPALFAQETAEAVVKTQSTNLKKNQRSKKERTPRTPRGNQTAIRDFFASLNDTERQELRDLQRSNPQEAKKVMAEKLEKYNSQRETRIKYLNSLIEKYHQTDEKEKKGEIYAEIKKMLTEDSEINLREHKRQLDFLELRLKTERERYETRTKNAEATIQKRIDELTKVKQAVE